jgi:hypothetical protein
MRTIELNGVNLFLTEETAEAIQRELDREREVRRSHWILFHWYGRRWAMYGDKYGDGGMFSDLYKDENGSRPHMTRAELFWILYERECWIEHGPHCREYRNIRTRGWR